MKVRIYLLLCAALLVSSCHDWWGKEKNKSYDKVMILYSAGCNNISSNLADDVREVRNAYVPEKSSGNALLVVSHRYVKGTQTTPYVIRFYKENKRVVADTLMTYPAGTFLTKASDMNKILSYVKGKFKSEHYGMVFSSHGSGWVPKGYYNEIFSNKPVILGGPSAGARMSAPPAPMPEGAVPYYEPEPVPGVPQTKSVGLEVDEVNGSTVSYEMDLNEFAAGIPMHLDYMLMDACLMGGVEVAYALRNVCDLLAFSPTEVLTDGFVYSTLASHLLEKKVPDLRSACVDYFQQYDNQSGEWRSASVSLVDCSGMDALASLSREYIGRYRSAIDNLDPSVVQRYYQGSKVHWFFDFEDILVKAGITASEKNALEKALSAAIMYKAATPTFLMSSPDVLKSKGYLIENFSGLSMYLPCFGDSILDDCYRTLAWNEAVGLVQ